MKTLLTTTALALCLATSAFANDPHNQPSGGDPIATSVAVANPTAIAGAAAGAEANAGAAALSGSVSNAINGPNTAITGPATATNIGGANTNLNTVNAGDNRATVGNVSSSSGPSTSSATLGNLNSFGGQGGSVIAPVTTTDINTNGQQQGQGQAQHSDTSTSTSTSTQQAQTLNDNSVHTQATTASTGASTSSASGNGAGQTTTFTQNYQAADIPKPSANTAYAAPSVVGGGVCAYTPFSAGISLRIVSGSASGAVIDAGCERRANADVLARLGYTAQATALLMQNPEVAAAFAKVGDTKAVAAVEPAAPVETATNTLLPTMPSDPARGTMLPIPNGPRTPRN